MIVTVVVAEPPAETDVGEGAGAEIPKPGTAAPVPDTVTCCEPVPALSVTIRFALKAPVAVGENVTLIVHICDGWTVLQLLVCLNSPSSAPPRVTLFTVSATAPVLVSVTGVGLLLVPTVCEGRVKEAGENFVPGTAAVELMRTNATALGASMIKSGFPSPFISAACRLGLLWAYK